MQPAGHADIGSALVSLSSCLQDKKQPREAEPFSREAVEIFRKSRPAGHPDISTALAALGRNLTDLGSAKEAEPLLREALAIYQKSVPRGNWQTPATTSLLGGCLSAQGRHDEAEPLVVESYEKLQTTTGASLPIIRQAWDRIVQLYEAWGKKDKAEEWRSKSLPAPGGGN